MEALVNSGICAQGCKTFAAFAAHCEVAEPRRIYGSPYRCVRVAAADDSTRGSWGWGPSVMRPPLSHRPDGDERRLPALGVVLKYWGCGHDLDLWVHP